MNIRARHQFMPTRIGSALINSCAHCGAPAIEHDRQEAERRVSTLEALIVVAAFGLMFLAVAALIYAGNQ